VCWYKFIVGPILFLKRKRSIVASSPKEEKKNKAWGIGPSPTLSNGLAQTNKKYKKKKRRSQPGPVPGFFFGFPPKSRKPDGDPRFAGDAESGEEGFATAKVQLWIHSHRLCDHRKPR
jgi:hypothetical protein